MDKAPNGGNERLQSGVQKTEPTSSPPSTVYWILPVEGFGRTELGDRCTFLVKKFHVLADRIAREFRATSKRAFVSGLVREIFVVEYFIDWKVKFMR